MNSIIFSKALATKVQEVVGFNIAHTPQHITPDTDIFGFIAVTSFNWPDDFNKTQQAISGAVTLYVPAMNMGVFGQEYGYEQLMELADITSGEDKSILLRLNNDRTISGTCTGFVAYTADITPIIDPDPESSAGDVWTMVVEFSAYIAV